MTNKNSPEQPLMPAITQNANDAEPQRTTTPPEPAQSAGNENNDNAELQDNTRVSAPLKNPEKPNSPECRIFYVITVIIKLVEFLTVIGNFAGLKQYAYIHHDKDDCAPHYQLILKYDSQRKINAMRRKCVEYDPHCSVERMDCEKSSLLYLLHRTKKAQKDGKCQYPFNALVYNDSYAHTVEQICAAQPKMSYEELMALLATEENPCEVIRKSGWQYSQIRSYIQYHREFANYREFLKFQNVKRQTADSESDINYINPPRKSSQTESDKNTNQQPKNTPVEPQPTLTCL